LLINIYANGTFYAVYFYGNDIGMTMNSPTVLKCEENNNGSRAESTGQKPE
jgi:hypothetical protein